MSGGMVQRKTCYNFPFSEAKLRIFFESCKLLDKKLRKRCNFSFLIVFSDLEIMSTENQVKSAKEIADEQKKKEEQEKRRKAEEERKIKEQAEVIACKFVRIQGIWKKKCQNTDGEWVLERYSASDIIADYGKKLGPAIMQAAPHCINSVNVPAHVNYHEILETDSNDLYYNTYFPLKYKPASGEWTHIDTLLHHIFGDQYEMGLDYVELLYNSPMTRLPILVLVSTENKTGKSTFCNLLREIFGQNAKAITKDTIDNRFNSTWATKLLAYCEETLVDKAALIDKIKNYATAEVVPTEKKGYDMQNEKVYIKLIMCSNDELHPTIIDQNDTRHWVRKVPVIQNNPGKSFADECKKEIPAFLKFLQNRKLSTRGTDRLWFTSEETRTDAWRKIVAGSRPEIEQDIAGFLEDIMDGAGLEEVKYSAIELLRALQDSPSIADYTKRRLSKVKVRDILRGWGLTASKESVRHDLYVMTYDGKVQLHSITPSVSSKIFVLTRKLMKELTV